MAATIPTSTNPFPLTNLANLVPSKLDGTNYLLWKEQLISIFISCDLLGHVDGSSPTPSKTITTTTTTGTITSTPNPEFHIWRKTDHFVRACINATITESLSSHILGLHTAKDVWDSLSDLFQQQSTARLSYLRNELQTITKGASTITEYLHEIFHATPMGKFEMRELSSFLCGRLEFFLLTAMGNSFCSRKPTVSENSSFNVICPSSGSSHLQSIKEIELIDEVDHISHLPDETLSYILSFLTLREAVGTSTLSRRWKYVWRTSIYNLDFDAGNMFGDNNPTTHQEWLERTNKFIRVVDQTLELLPDSKIERFRICSHLGNKHTSYLYQWISFAIMSGAKELQLDLYDKTRGRPYRGVYNIPYWPLAHGKESSLNHLHLSCCSLTILGPYPAFKCFESLSTLSLEYVSVTETDVEDLLCYCSLLEWLKLEKCSRLMNLRISGPSLGLKYLGVNELSQLVEIKLCAASLVTFEFTGNIVNFCFENAPQLVNVMLHFVSFHTCDGATFALKELPAYLPQLETLFIYNTRLYVEPLFPSESLPTYTNLSQLVMVAGSPEKDFLLWIVTLLKVSPFLKKLQLHLAHLKDEMETREIMMPSSFPHSCLKFVEVNGFAGYIDQIDIIKYILKNAIALQSLLIDPHHRFYLGDGKWKTHDHQCLLSRRERRRICKLLLEESQPGVRLTIL